eukprot:1137755-Pelagomonas_calceolata.AAC.6
MQPMILKWSIYTPIKSFEATRTSNTKASDIKLLAQGQRTSTLLGQASSLRTEYLTSQGRSGRVGRALGMLTCAAQAMQGQAKEKDGFVLIGWEPCVKGVQA